MGRVSNDTNSGLDTLGMLVEMALELDRDLVLPTISDDDRLGPCFDRPFDTLVQRDVFADSVDWPLSIRNRLHSTADLETYAATRQDLGYPLTGQVIATAHEDIHFCLGNLLTLSDAVIAGDERDALDLAHSLDASILFVSV